MCWFDQCYDTRSDQEEGIVGKEPITGTGGAKEHAAASCAKE